MKGIAAADFNGDGLLDLAICDEANNQVVIFIGNGLGDFIRMNPVEAGLLPQKIVTADFNHDGKIDLAVLNSVSSMVSILLGNGNGSFQPALNFIPNSPLMKLKSMMLIKTVFQIFY